MTFELAPLPYAYDALVPYISQKTLEFHHDKHHQTYLTNLNKLIKGTDFATLSLADIILNTANDTAKQGIFNNAGQHWNHSFFWKSMTASKHAIPAALQAKIDAAFGSVEAFKEAFIQGGLTQFGSGWVWLVQNDRGDLEIMKTANADTPIAHGKTALLVADVWEHSYYLDYQNKRPAYLKAFIDNLANWEHAAAHLKS